MEKWKYNYSGAMVRSEDDQEHICDLRGFGGLERKHGENAACEIMDARGRLIAAAPELLEAINSALKIVDLWGPSESIDESEAQALSMMREEFERVIRIATTD